MMWMLLMGCRSDAALPEERLTRRIQQLRFESDCASELSRQMIHYTPIPTVDDEGRVWLEVLLGPSPGLPSQVPKQWSPTWRGTIDLATGEHASCVRIRDEPVLLGERMFGGAHDGVESYLEDQSLVYRLTEALVVPYGAGRTMPAKQVARYRALFDATTSPLMATYYQELNPDWWSKTH